MPQNIGYLTAKTDKASDEVYTAAFAVKPLLKYLRGFQQSKDREIIVWCPFDLEESEYVKIFQNEGYQVIHSHIEEGKNFFFYEPDEYDIIISNPPFSIKDDIIKHLYELGKPYAILLPIPALQGQRRFPYMTNCQALIFDKRINYYTDKEKKQVQKGVSFGSFYLCRDFLPKDLIFEKLEDD